MQLKDKVVFITGGARGFGRAVAEEVLKRGGKVALADVIVEVGESSAKELQSTYGEGNAIFVKCDVTNGAQFEEAFKTATSKFGYVDIMCNNAGIMDESVWEKQIDINFSGVVRGTNLAINQMKGSNGGKGGLIINTASMAAMAPIFWFPVYAGTKSAVYNFTASWAQNPEMKADNIRFMNICPTGAKTPLLNLREDQIINLPHFKAAMEEDEYVTVEQVVEAFLRAMEDDSLNGCALTITKDGVKPAKLVLAPLTQ